MERLLEIKALIDKGINLAGIKQVISMQQEEREPLTYTAEQVGKVQQDLSDKELRKLLKNELMHGNRFGKSSLRQGELSRFFH